MPVKVNKNGWLITLIFFVSSVLIRLFSIRMDLGKTYNYILYALTAAAVLFIALSVYKKDADYSHAFDNTGAAVISVFAYLSAAVFFADFVLQCVNVYRSIDSGAYTLLVKFVPLCFICVFALLSSFCFVSVGLSYSNDYYDFRALKLLHAAPLCWALIRMLAVLTNVVKFSADADAIIKYAAMIFALCFFYKFASETENDKVAEKGFIFVCRAYSYIGVFYFVCRVIMLAAGNQDFYISADDNFFALCVLFTSSFAYFLQNNISKDSEAKNL